ncbi:MAG: IS256 family transposase [Bdellovibrionota bacterium]
MGIIKVEVNLPELTEAITALEKERRRLFQLLHTELKTATANAIEQVLNSEITVFLGKNSEKDNKRNGYRIRNYAVKGIGGITFRMPTDRKRRFESALIPKNEQIDPRLKEDMAVFHLAGISTRDLKMMSKRILGVEISNQTVSNSLTTIEDRAVEWLTRPISGRYWALYVDGTNFYIQRRGSTEREPSLVVLGIDENNRKSILAIEPGTKDNVDAWAAVFSELIRRGLKTEDVRIGIMDGLPGLESLFKTTFPKAVTARCWIHALKNALAKAPARLRGTFKAMLTRVMYASSEDTAREAFKALKEAMGADAERAVYCIEKDLESLVVHYRFDKRFWIALKTTNPIERVNREFKKRSRAMGSMGEGLLESLLAFTALRLEMGWKQVPVDAKQLARLNNVGEKTNAIENTMAELLH